MFAAGRSGVERFAAGEGCGLICGRFVIDGRFAIVGTAAAFEFVLAAGGWVSAAAGRGDGLAVVVFA